MPTILVTGGAGFIGSNFIRFWMMHHPQDRVINVDKLTYAGNRDNLVDLESDPRYRFVHGDVCDVKAVEPLAKQADFIVNFAAETHVDRSILNPADFVLTATYGTHFLLEAARRNRHRLYTQISTDEVYGSIDEGTSMETSRLQPSSPYSASKAAADLIVGSYYKTFGLPTLIIRCSNNFGPYQYPEKFIPLMITNALEDKPLPIYGDGLNVGDWIYVLDTCEGIACVLKHGAPGQIYPIGGGQPQTNLSVAHKILEKLGKPREMTQFVKDRPGHDLRYAMELTKSTTLGFKPRYRFDEALRLTIRWYQDNQAWWRKIKTGEFQQYYQRAYLAGT